MGGKQLDLGQLYGYAVCLVAVVTFVIASHDLTGAVLDFRELPYSESYTNGPTLVSLEAYKMELLGRLGMRDWSAGDVSVVPSDSAFREMFEQERLYRLALSHQTNRRRIAVSSVLLGVAVLLFGSHWIWLRRREDGQPERRSARSHPGTA